MIELVASFSSTKPLLRLLSSKAAVCRSISKKLCLRPWRCLNCGLILLSELLSVLVNEMKHGILTSKMRCFQKHGILTNKMHFFSSRCSLRSGFICNVCLVVHRMPSKQYMVVQYEVLTTARRCVISLITLRSLDRTVWWEIIETQHGNVVPGKHSCLKVCNELEGTQWNEWGINTELCVRKND